MATKDVESSSISFADALHLLPGGQHRYGWPLESTAVKSMSVSPTLSLAHGAHPPLGQQAPRPWNRVGKHVSSAEQQACEQRAMQWALLR